MTNIDLSVSVVNYKTYGLVEKCLASVFSKTKQISFEVILVDNATVPEALLKIKRKFSKISFIENSSNLGFAAANNQAYKISNGRYFVLLNSDTELKNDALSILVQFMDENQECGISCPQLIYPDNKSQKSYSKFRTPFARSKWEYSLKLKELIEIFNRRNQISKTLLESNNLVLPIQNTLIERPRGVCFLIRNTTIDEIGLMDERFFMYNEEVDWAFRAIKAGWKNYFIPESMVLHHWGASTKKRKKLLDDIHTQSDFKYHYKHYGIKGWLILWSGHFFGCVLSLMLGILYSILRPFNVNRYKPSQHFAEFFRLLRKLIILLGDIRLRD